MQRQNKTAWVPTFWEKVLLIVMALACVAAAALGGAIIELLLLFQ